MDLLPIEAMPICLCLSGRGFRSALFHAGALTRLDEVGVLDRLSCISGVSGGTIALAVLGWLWKTQALETVPLQKGLMIKRALTSVCGQNLLQTAEDKSLLLNVEQSQSMEEAYASILPGNYTLSELPDKSRLFFGTTNVEMARHQSFVNMEVRDRVTTASMPRPLISRILAASTACPPLINPVPIAIGSSSAFYMDGAITDPIGLLSVPQTPAVFLLSLGESQYRSAQQTTWRGRWQTLQALQIALGVSRQREIARFQQELNEGQRIGLSWESTLQSTEQTKLSAPLLYSGLYPVCSKEQEDLMSEGYDACSLALKGLACISS